MIVVGVGCSVEQNSVVSVDSNSINSPSTYEFQENKMEYSLVDTDSGSVNSFSPTTSSFDEPCDAATCIDPPEPPGGGGGSIACTPSDLYRLEASVNGTGAYTYSSNIPTYKLKPYWGNIIKTAEAALENTSQNGASPYHDDYPFHEVVDLDRKAKITTKLLSNGQLEFSLTLYELYSKAWFNSNSGFVSNAEITIEADEIEIAGLYTIANDLFLLTDYEFINLGIDLSLNGFIGWVADTFGFSSTIESRVEIEIKDLIQTEIDSFNKNNPNMYLSSIIDHSEIENILPVLDQAISELIKNDIEANLEIEVPNCTYYPNRDGLILLEVNTNP